MENEKPGEEISVVQERLNWQVAWRDDEKVAQALYAGEPIEEMHHLSDAGLLDEFFVFLKELGMLEAFGQVSQSGVKRTLVPTVQFVLLYCLKILLGAESMNELPRVLFSDLALMEMVGFNAHQCENGLTARGDAMRQKKKKQGPITAQCLAENICKLTQEEMERLFNQMCSLLARQGLFRGKLLVALDGSKLPTPKSYEGCGKVKQTRKVKVKGQKEEATEEYYVYGWKLLVLIEVQTRLPLASKVVQCGRSGFVERPHSGDHFCDLWQIQHVSHPRCAGISQRRMSGGSRASSAPGSWKNRHRSTFAHRISRCRSADQL